MPIGYHFTADTLRDRSPIPPIGQALIFDGKIEICRSGLHWSEHPFDALKYASGPLLHLVECSDPVETHDDKCVSRQRTILKTIDATSLLRRFAADRALSVAHLWDMPTVVRDYLVSLDEGIRDAARAAAGAARDAARDAERAAAWAARDAAWAAWAARDAARAARDAAWAAGAARDAARAAERDAAWAAWAAAGDAAMDTARAAEWAVAVAARSVARSVAWYASWAYAGDSWDAARDDFKQRVDVAFNSTEE